MTGWALWVHGVEPVPQLVNVAQAAEREGASALLIADELIERDIYVVLAAVAAATERIMLVPAITNPYTRHPITTAVALASLAELAPGRVVAGLGVGGNMVLDPIGVTPVRPFTALKETIDVVDRLLAGEMVDHEGQFTASRASIPWSPERLPVGIAGRGPRVLRLATESAGWLILAGKSVGHVGQLVHQVRAQDDGDQRVVVWNPSVAWHAPHVDTLREQFAYITVDLPPQERSALGISDELLGRLRASVHHDGPAAAAALVPDSVMRHYAITGERDDVVAELARGVTEVRPDLVAFPAHAYTTEFVSEIAQLAADAGIGTAVRHPVVGAP